MSPVELHCAAMAEKQTKINELKAMVNVLHSALAGAQEHQWCGLRHNGRDNKHPLWVAGVNALNNTPTQCLANVKADAIDSAIGDIGIAMANTRLDSDDVLSYLINESNKLRKTMITTSSESSLSEVVNKINEEL